VERVVTHGIDPSAVQYALPPESNAPAEEQPSPSGIVELPSFTDEETSRPTVQMPPLVERSQRPSIDDAFDRGADDGPATPAEPHHRSRGSTLRGVMPPSPRGPHEVP
jgi:hypothetical protein